MEGLCGGVPDPVGAEAGTLAAFVVIDPGRLLPGNAVGLIPAGIRP